VRVSVAARRDRQVGQREPRSSRRPLVGEPGRRILVVCGAEKTESDYLNALKQQQGLRGLRVVPQPRGKGKDPEKVVRQALQLDADSADRYDEVWCVLDVDTFDLDPAVRIARTAGVRLAISNPCFELWLLLHREECGASLTTAQAKARLRKRVREYDKARLDFGDFAAGVDNAVERSRRLHDGATVGTNPSSGMWKLVEMIMKEAKR
jgi:RloB-like protein